MHAARRRRHLLKPVFLLVCASLTGCWSLFNLLPPLPSAACTTFVDVTELVATDAGTAKVTVGCNQAPASACDGGTPPACATSACIEVDWVGVSASFNGNCSQASPQGLAAAGLCTPLSGDAGVTLSFVAPGRVPAPEIVFAQLSDAGVALGCDADCAQAAATCTCNEALAGTPGQACTALK